MKKPAAILIASILFIAAARGKERPKPPKQFAFGGKNLTITNLRNPYFRPMTEEGKPAYFAALREGKDLYYRHCVACHGAAMDGRGQDGARTQAWTHAELSGLSDGYIFWRIAAGAVGPEGKMAGWEGRLSEDEIWKTVLWMRTYLDRDYQRLQASASAHPGEAPRPGRYYYRLHCGHCHGYKPGKAAPAGDFYSPKPPRFAAGFRLRSGKVPSEEELARIIRDGSPGTAMPAWKWTLGPDDIGELARYLKSL